MSDRPMVSDGSTPEWWAWFAGRWVFVVLVVLTVAALFWPDQRVGCTVTVSGGHPPTGTTTTEADR